MTEHVTARDSVRAWAKESVPVHRIPELLAERKRGKRLVGLIKTGEIDCRVVTDEDDKRFLAEFMDRP